ncbi:MAG TPA: hypothetical protein VJU79_07085 [Candidatus Dormibacteraeota bacterium]|nr:hypothetical protein [Candidatus Dormibacteraeota bacterium]
MAWKLPWRKREALALAGLAAVLAALGQDRVTGLRCPTSTAPMTRHVEQHLSPGKGAESLRASQASSAR